MSPTLPIRSNAARRIIRRAVLSLEQPVVPRTISVQTVPRNTPPQRKTTYRTFSSTSFLCKKKTKADREAAAEAPSQTAEDPFDFSILEASIAKALKKLENDLSKLRTGGRFNPEIIENLRVHLIKDSKKTERLGDLAQVLPKSGRSLMILVGEKEHIHAITTAIQASPELNLQPQPDAANASQLNVPIPPPTKESRDAALNKAKEEGEEAKVGVQGARAVCQKRLRGMEKAKSVRPDDLKKAGKAMEGVVEKGMGEVKKLVDAARKGMEQT